MNKESLDNRLKEIEKAIEQSVANLNMLVGGKEEILYWLKQLEPTNKGIELRELKKVLNADSIELVDAKKG